MIRSLLLTLLVSLFAHAGCADVLDDALSAKGRGDFAAAYPLWVELAEMGDDKAAVEVGLMHHLGQGVPQDYGLAMGWYLKVLQRNGDAVNNMGAVSHGSHDRYGK